MSLLEVNHLKKVYVTRLGGQKCLALVNVSFSAEAGEFTAVMGESGSGKTTLLNIVASLDKATSGEVMLDGIKLREVKDKEISAFRRENLGFVFQDFNLLDTFSIKDNILLPMVLSRKTYAQMEERLIPLARQLEIEPLLEKYPYEVSGGQKQRTAVARALITFPKLVLADEPTGALDSRAASRLLHIFTELNRNGQTILMVTHSARAASYAQRVLFMKDGEIFHQLYKGEMSNEMMFKKISDTLTVLSNGGDNGE